MSDAARYDKQHGDLLQQPAATDTIALTNVVESAYIQDSVSAELDSLLRTPSDSLFRFYEVELPEKIFLGRADYPRDTAYYEKLHWKGLPVNYREEYSTGSDWITILLFVLVILLSSVRIGYGRYISTLFHSLVSYSASVRMFREKNYSILHGAVRLEFMFYIIISLFSYLVFVNVSNESANFKMMDFGIILGILGSYFILKKLLYRALGNIFIGASDTNEVIFNMDNYYRAAGIVLLPVVAFIAFNSSGSVVIAIVTGIFLFVVFYLTLLKRCISILLKKQISILYLFLYLCTLEFLPLLMIYKLVVNQAG